VSGRTSLIYSNKFSEFSYGESHPFKVQRFRLAYELIKAYSLDALENSLISESDRISEKDILSFHDVKYIERMKEFNSSPNPRADFLYGLGDAENPVFPGFYDWACLGTAGTLEAARLVAEEGVSAAFNLAGGYHHAHRSKAAGFSYLNDAVIAINYLLAKGKRVVYLDIDAHHGDGVQEAYYDTDQVLVISMHESGIYFFPGTGFENETGVGKGLGYTVNLPLIAHTDDPIYMKAFDEAVYPLIAAYDPDIIFTQLGADSFRTDPLTRLEVTTHSYSYILRKIKALRIPWVGVGGGWYDLMNTARAWTIAWGIMNGITLPAKLPAAFVESISAMGYPNRMLFDAMHWAEEDDRNLALDAVEKSIATIRKEVFPLLIGSNRY
jgi:acetoin utilization protein AcuC